MAPDILSGLSDAELANRVATGRDPSGAWAMLFARHHLRLHALLLSQHPGIADDVGQEAWLRVFEDLRKAPREITNFRGWLFRIAQNLARDRYRRKKGEPIIDGDDPPAGGQSALAEMLDQERRDVVRECLKKLTANLHQVIVAVMSGETPPDIAKKLGISRDTVDQRKSRAVMTLTECVKKRLA